MDSLIYHNDRIVPLREAHLSPGQMGLLLGWGVFTTLRIYQGIPFAFRRHWDRLVRDAERLRIPLDFRQDAVQQAMIKLAAANERPEGVARLSFVRNHGGPWADAPDCPPTDLLIFTRPLNAWPEFQKLLLVPNSVFSAGKLAGAKMLSWGENASTLERVRGQGFDDALLLNELGHVVECTSANIFVVRSRSVLTPPLTSGCLPGITREILRDVVPLAGYGFGEQDLTLADLDTAEEVFLSSTTREVAGVGSIQPNWNYSAPGKATRAIAKTFHSYVLSHLQSAPSSPSSPPV